MEWERSFFAKEVRVCGMEGVATANTLKNVEEGRFQLTEIDTKVFEIEKWHEQRNR